MEAVKRDSKLSIAAHARTCRSKIKPLMARSQVLALTVGSIYG
jgi:hypothetical protein